MCLMLTYDRLTASHQNRQNRVDAGTTDAPYNKGPRFWYKLDDSVFAELESQFASFKAESVPSFHSDVCFGLAQKVTAIRPTYLDRLIEFLTEAAKQGYSPARAVYAQIVKAHGLKPMFAQETLNKWTLQAISEGYLFADTSSEIAPEEIFSAQKRFREAGGYCADPFLNKANILAALEKQEAFDKPERSIDHVGNTALHASAALGDLGRVKSLIQDHNALVNIENDNAETPLYKACQAGHAEVVSYLLEKGARASTQTKHNGLTPLHWLFVFPPEQIKDVARMLVEKGKADVNAVMDPFSPEEATNRFPQKVFIEHL